MTNTKVIADDMALTTLKQKTQPNLTGLIRSLCGRKASNPPLLNSVYHRNNGISHTGET